MRTDEIRFSLPTRLDVYEAHLNLQRPVSGRAICEALYEKNQWRRREVQLRIQTMMDEGFFTLDSGLELMTPDQRKEWTLAFRNISQHVLIKPFVPAHVYRSAWKHFPEEGQEPERQRYYRVYAWHRVAIEGLPR